MSLIVKLVAFEALRALLTTTVKVMLFPLMTMSLETSFVMFKSTYPIISNGA